MKSFKIKNLYAQLHATTHTLGLVWPCTKHLRIKAHSRDAKSGLFLWHFQERSNWVFYKAILGAIWGPTTMSLQQLVWYPSLNCSCCTSWSKAVNSKANKYCTMISIRITDSLVLSMKHFSLLANNDWHNIHWCLLQKHLSTLWLHSTNAYNISAQ